MSFHQNYLYQPEYITLDAFYAIEILTSKAIQLQKMTIQLQKSIFIHYSNNDYYINVYYYYTNKQVLLVDYACHAMIKK